VRPFVWSSPEMTVCCRVIWLCARSIDRSHWYNFPRYAYRFISARRKTYKSTNFHDNATPATLTQSSITNTINNKPRELISNTAPRNTAPRYQHLSKPTPSTTQDTDPKHTTLRPAHNNLNIRLPASMKMILQPMVASRLLRSLEFS
jgi:hypothetical protein